MRFPTTVAVLVTLAFAGCSDAGSVSKSIGQAVRKSGLSEVRLVDETPFQWDTVYFFQPYTPRSTVCKTLKVKDEECERVVPKESRDDGLMSLAFLQGARVVHYELHSRANGDFTPVPESQPVAAEFAVFQVVRPSTTANEDAQPKLVLKCCLTSHPSATTEAIR